MAYIFGPIPSRRLGLSLGVDIVKPKTCTFDCIYCQIGKTKFKSSERKSFIKTNQILEELRHNLINITPDTITISGSGEPTLNRDIPNIIEGIKSITRTRVAIITNGSLMWDGSVREGIKGADMILPTLSTSHEEIFKMIHRPHESLSLSKIIEGLISLRSEFDGLIYLEVMILAEINDSEQPLEALREVVEKISPDKIQLNTVVRPPSDKRARPIDIKRMEYIKDMFGSKAEVIAYETVKADKSSQEVREDEIIQMASRRPIRSVDVSHALGIDLRVVEDIINGLCKRGRLIEEIFNGEAYYMVQ